MIVRVVEPPKGKKSSFSRLASYISAGIDAHVDSRAVSFDKLTSYMTAETALGDQVEKCIAVEAGNVTNLQNAAKEMWAIGQQNPRCKDPVYHYLLSWPENERPPVAEIFEAARHTLTALGLQEHQYIVAVHVNTDNIHAHVEVNRVHPTSFKAKHLEWAHKTLHKAAREMELKFGWQHDPGLWEVMEIGGKKVLFPRKSYLQDILPLSSKAKKFEIWNGRESFEGWLKKKPAHALRRALENPTSWQGIHQALSAYGIELTDSGGGLRVELLRQGEEDRPVAIAASKVFRFMKRKDLEKAIGPFVPLDPNGPAPAQVERYKRDPIKRLTRRLERLAQRENLWDEYLAYRESVKAEQAEKNAILAEWKQGKKQADAERYRLYKASYAAKRNEIKADKSLSDTQKQQAYILLKMTYMQSREELKDQLAAERRSFDDLMPKVKSWREWVEEQAQQGNEAAISALRGMVYEEKRQAKRGSEEAEEKEEPMPSIRPAPARPGDAPTIKSLSMLAWRVSTNGRIFYRFKTTNEHAFIDEGQRLTFGRPDVTDEALLATLRYAKMKWGNTLHLTGGDAVFRERVLHLASSLNMTVNNQELKELQQKAIEARTVPPTTHGKETHQIVPLEARFKRDNPAAQVTIPAEIQEKTYRGKIERVDHTHALQQVGKDRYVLHDLRMLDRLPAVGADVAIRYCTGSGKVAENTRSKGR